MPYQSTDKTRQKKDSKRTSMMQAAVRVFAEKGYHAATVRDVVAEADVAIGTFYFYFPDKETLFVYLYEETAEFLAQTIEQAISGRNTFLAQITAGVQSYVNVALYEPAVIQLLLVGGVGAVPALNARRLAFRERLTNIWQRPIDRAADRGQVVAQNSRRTAEALVGALDEVILNLISQPNPDLKSEGVVHELVAFAMRAVGYVPAGNT